PQAAQGEDAGALRGPHEADGREAPPERLHRRRGGGGGRDDLGTLRLGLQAVQAPGQVRLSGEGRHHDGNVRPLDLVHDYSTSSRLRPGPQRAPTHSPTAQLTTKTQTAGRARTNHFRWRPFLRTAAVMRASRTPGSRAVAAA